MGGLKYYIRFNFHTVFWDVCPIFCHPVVNLTIYHCFQLTTGWPQNMAYIPQHTFMHELQRLLGIYI